MAHYTLRCVECGQIYDDSEKGFLLDCQEAHGPSMLQADYAVNGFEPVDSAKGLFRYQHWLPIRRTFSRAPQTIVFQSDALSNKLELENLYFAFNGYWPERDGGMKTCSFKELEAASILARIPKGEERTIVVSSAGNTGRAFLEYGSQFKINTMVVVPEFALPQMWTTVPKADCVKLVVLKDADYFDAIQLANHICELEPFFAEGGAKNIARRDGMGTVILAATEEMKCIPQHYFQAVGSGTGAIATWEMAWRLIMDGQFGQRLPRFHLSQSEAFTILADAWVAQSRDLPDIPEDEARAAALKAYSPVLSNRKPPYGLTGGLFDALSETGGLFYVPSDEQSKKAGELFQEFEGIDLDKAAQVCLASLFIAKEQGTVGEDDYILVNLTGGGAERAHADGIAIPATPDYVFTKAQDNLDDIRRMLAI
ncbi:MAG: cysteate synthase [Victivallales bacterium]|nr:cysteate synthase [Victivallales bacterium]